MPIKRILAAVSLVAALALAGCSSADGASDETDTSAGAETGAPEADLDGLPDVVAEVNGDEITLDEFTRNYEGQLQQAAMQSQTTGEEVDQDALKEQVANLLVDNHLLTQAAAKAGIKPTDANIDDELTGLAEQNGMESGDDVLAALKEQGLSEDEVREDLATQYQVTAYIEQEADIADPSDAELQEQYDALVEQQSAAADAGGEMPPFEDVKEQLAEQSKMQQQNEAAQGIVDALREGADITIHL